MTERLSHTYSYELVNTSLSALLEIGRTLKTYHDSIVLIGGWAPYFLIKKYGESGFQHIGSIDIDLALDLDNIAQDEYATILELIDSRGYRQRKGSTGEPIYFSFEKDLISPINGETYLIQIDFLTTEEKHSAHRHQKIQPDLLARTAAGCNLAFKHKLGIEIEGLLPDGAETKSKLNVIDIEGCLGMKGTVLGERYLEKDAYDIYTVTTQCLHDVKEVANKVKPFLGDPSMKHGIENIREKFSTQRAEGPTWAALFIEPYDKEKRERVQAEVYTTMQRFLKALDD